MSDEDVCWREASNYFLFGCYSFGTFELDGFIAIAPFVGVAIGVYLFGKISMALFNPAVTVGYLITKHLRRELFFYYLSAEIIGALLGSLLMAQSRR